MVSILVRWKEDVVRVYEKQSTNEYRKSRLRFLNNFRENEIKITLPVRHKWKLKRCVANVFCALQLSDTNHTRYRTQRDFGICRSYCDMKFRRFFRKQKYVVENPRKCYHFFDLIIIGKIRKKKNLPSARNRDNRLTFGQNRVINTHVRKTNDK